MYTWNPDRNVTLISGRKNTIRKKKYKRMLERKAHGIRSI